MSKRTGTTFTAAETRTLRIALHDAIRDRESFVDAYTFPSYAKVDAETRRVRREAVTQIKRYRRLLAKISAAPRPQHGRAVTQ